MTPADVPAALAHTLAEALNRYETSGLCPLRGACELCDCGADMQSPEQQADDYRRALDRARHALAAVLPDIQAQAWQEGYITRAFTPRGPGGIPIQEPANPYRLTTTTEEPSDG